MGLDLAPVAVEVARRPLGRWEDETDSLGQVSRSINWLDVARVTRYMRASGAMYEMVAPGGRSPFSVFPELDRRSVQAIWDGLPAPGIASPERLAAFYAQEYAHASAHEDRPGMPSFKLQTNGPPWHVTVEECRSVLEIGISTRPIDGDEPGAFAQVRAVWDEDVVAIFTLGIQQAGVMVM